MWTSLNSLVEQKPQPNNGWRVGDHGAATDTYFMTGVKVEADSYIVALENGEFVTTNQRSGPRLAICEWSDYPIVTKNIELTYFNSDFPIPTSLPFFTSDNHTGCFVSFTAETKLSCAMR